MAIDSPRSLIPALRVRRDRHDRGMRGPAVAALTPSYRTRSQIFDDCVVRAITDIEHRLPHIVANISFAIEDSPIERDLVLRPLDTYMGRVDSGNPPRCVVYRMPLMMSSEDHSHMERLIRDALARLIGDIAGLRPQEIDAEFEGD